MNIPLDLEDANVTFTASGISQSHDEDQQSFRIAIQEEHRVSPLKNLHREITAHQDTCPHLDVQWVL